MKIVVTLGNLVEKGCWEQYCEEKGWDPWCINEGRAYTDEEVTLTKEQAIRYGLIEDEKRW